MAPLRSTSVTPLAGNQMFFRSLIGDEAMGGLFEYQVQVLTKNGDIKLAQALGTNMTVSVPLSNGTLRHFNGFITRFTRIGQVGNFFLYRAVLHPWLWSLSRNADLRIFQRHSVPEIVKKIFRKYQTNLFEEALGEYKPREYTVQYRETDLNFISRLLECEGIAFHFAHDLGKHTLVLTDGVRRRDAAPGYKTVPLRQATDAGQDECFVSWNDAQEIQPSAYMLKDFDYQKPKAPLVSALPSTASPDFHVDGEFYDYPGNYLDTDAGNRLVGLRLQQAQSFYETFEASGPVRGVGVGNVFGLEGPLALGTDREYLIVKAHYEIHGHIPDSSNAADKDESFTCSITAVDSKIPFRPARLTPTPIVQGPQTATVVGPKKDDPGKDEIWTDDLGRVLVKFHWERRGPLKPQDTERDDEDQDNELAPCWLRVAQLWAGAGWGTVFIPRIGQEVMVEFLEGDPDRPIVTGRLYNGDNKPAYLGENKATQSGIRTRSSPEGGPKNFNEIRFEDKKGSEELYIQAEKDHKSHVKHNRSADVGASDSISVGGDRSLTVSGNLSVTVDGGGKSEHHSDHKVKGKYNLYASDTIDIGAKNQITLTVNQTYIKITEDTITLHAVGGGEVILTANVDAHSDGKSSLLLDGNAKLTGKANATITGATLLAHGDETARIEGKAMTAHADEAGAVQAKTLTVHGDTSTAVEGGAASIHVTDSGIDAKGNEIKLNG